MARLCTICRHPERSQIDRDLMQGFSQGALAKRYGVSQSSLSRHRLRCVTEVIAAGNSVLVAAGEGITLVDEIQDIKAKTVAIYEAAKTKDPHLALAALGSLTKQVEVFTSMMLKHEELNQTRSNIRHDPEFIEIRGRIVKALIPYPEARADVLKALSE